jgi:hypothetical protein
MRLACNELGYHPRLSNSKSSRCCQAGAVVTSNGQRGLGSPNADWAAPVHAWCMPGACLVHAWCMPGPAAFLDLLHTPAGQSPVNPQQALCGALMGRRGKQMCANMT